MKVEFKKYLAGTVFNEVRLNKKVTLLRNTIEISYPTRLEAMVFDPAKIESNDRHIYTAGQINFTVALFRKIKIEVLNDSDQLIIEGSSVRTSLIKHAYGLMKKALGFTIGMKIEWVDDVNIKHCGLGSSSAIIAATCSAINEIFGNPISRINLMKYIVQNHVEEIEGDNEFVFPVQSIGGSAAAGLFGNGMVIIAGEAVVVESMSITEDFYVIFGVPFDYVPKDSERLMADEADNFKNFNNTGNEHAKEIAYRFLHKCLPDIKLGNLKEVGNLIYDYRFNMGSIKNCSFCYDGLVELGDKLRVIKESNLAEVLALSSVGPGFFAITKSKKEVVEIFESLNLRTFETKCYNGGYIIKIND